MSNEHKLISTLRSQAKSTEVWFENFRRYKDTSSRINAAMALGRFSGMVNIVREMKDIVIPEDILTQHEKGTELWEEVQTTN